MKEQKRHLKLRKKLEKLERQIEEELAKNPDIHKNPRYDFIRLEKLIYGLGDIIENILIINNKK